MQITTPQGDRPKPDLSSWGVPWPSADDLQRDADTAWAVEVGFADPGAFGVDMVADLDPGAFDVDTVAFPEPAGSDAAMPGQMLDELERQVRERHRATAAEYRLIRLLLDRAAADPVPWVGPDPTLDLAWSDIRGRTVAAVRRDRRDVAERAAIAEIATRLRLSEQTVRARAARAEVLQTRCPDVWGAFTEGNISERHAVEAARLATSLPDAEDTPVAEPVASSDEAGLIAGDVEPADDDGDAGDHGSPSNSAAAEMECDSPPSEHASWRVFDEGALDRAIRLPPARFAVAARSLRDERVLTGESAARRRRVPQLAVREPHPSAGSPTVASPRASACRCGNLTAPPAVPPSPSPTSVPECL